LTKTEKLLCELIALPSVNPAFLPANDPHAGEQRVADLLTAAGRRAGLEVISQPVFPNRANLLARLSPRGRIQRRVLLAPHLDTVGGDEMPGSLFTPRARHGRLHGRGACDTKGSVAAMFAALCQVAQSRQRPEGTDIIFAGLVDEENGQGGSRALVASGFKADLAIVGEPTRLRTVTAHKGDLWLQLETRGKAAHGARPELGRNAVHAMARIVDCLETTYARQLRRRRHALLGHATVNVGSIAGGGQPNIVPDRCVISVDRRTLPGETDAGVKRQIKTLLRRHHLPARLIDAKGVPCRPLETSPRHPLVGLLLRCTGQKRPLGVDYFSDAGVLADGQIPSVLFGPGDIAQAHTPDEWVELRQLEQAKNLLVAFLQSLSP
jgi:acetylornithine deacetylase/succinyl-diaminopimelate desuccinylase-like protein